MLYTFSLQGGVLREVASDADAAANLELAQWIDVVDGQEEERARLERVYQADLPGSDDVEEIESAADPA